MAAAACFQIVVGGGHLKFPQKYIGHHLVVMLSGVHQYFIDLAVLPQPPGHECGFDELGTSSKYREDSHDKGRIRLQGREDIRHARKSENPSSVYVEQ